MAPTAHRRWRSASNVLTLVLLLISILSAFSLTAGARKAQAATQTSMQPTISYGSSYDVIFLHGFNAQAAIDCNATWGSAETYLRNHGWLGQFYTLGFYNGDMNCSFNRMPDDASCTSYHDGNRGTVDEDLKHLACNLAWYIYNNWTYSGKPVFVVTHSMGGLIIRWALHIYADTRFPFPRQLNVPAVVTMATPHQGVPPGSAAYKELVDGCPSPCNQVQQMETTPDPTNFINDLINNGVNPQGTGGTKWTTMRSVGQINCDPIGSDMQGAHQISYGDNSVSQPAGEQTSPACYDHGTYLTDQSDDDSFSGAYCDNCGSVLGGSARPFDLALPHSLRAMELGLIGGSVSSPFAVSPGWAMTNATGRLEVFPHGTDNSVQHAWQLYANQNSWSGWQQLDTSFSTFATWPSGVLNVDGREELFARRSDNQVVFTSQDDFNGASGWITWAPVSPSSLTFVSAVAAGRNSDGRLEIVALASDGHLYHNYQNNPADDFSWHGWVQMTQSFLGTPVMAQNLDGRLEIIAIGSDHALWWTVEGSTSNPSTPGWSSWNSLGGWWPGNTAAVIRNRVGQLEAFARGTTGYMYHAWQTSTGSNSWTSWHSMGGSWIGDPVAIMTRDQREQVFAVNSDHAVWWVVQVLGGTGADSGWSNWHSLGGWWPGTLAVAHNSDDRLEVFAPGTTHYLYNAVQDSAGNWSGWNSMGGSWQ